jgi:hypothetical protein
MFKPELKIDCNIEARITRTKSLLTIAHYIEDGRIHRIKYQKYNKPLPSFKELDLWTKKNFGKKFYRVFNQNFGHFPTVEPYNDIILDVELKKMVIEGRETMKLIFINSQLKWRNFDKEYFEQRMRGKVKPQLLANFKAKQGVSKVVVDVQRNVRGRYALFLTKEEGTLSPLTLLEVFIAQTTFSAKKIEHIEPLHRLEVLNLE